MAIILFFIIIYYFLLLNSIIILFPFHLHIVQHRCTFTTAARMLDSGAPKSIRGYIRLQIYRKFQVRISYRRRKRSCCSSMCCQFSSFSSQCYGTICTIAGRRYRLTDSLSHPVLIFHQDKINCITILGRTNDT